jgi:hypothetical protein
MYINHITKLSILTCGWTTLSAAADYLGVNQKLTPADTNLNTLAL